MARKRLRFALGALVFLRRWRSPASRRGEPAHLLRQYRQLLGYIDRLFKLENGARVWTDFAEWFWGWPRWLRLLGETLLIGYVGTLLGAVGVLADLPRRRQYVAGALASLRRAPAPRVCRTVPGIVFALIFVIAFGLGPMAGVLAIAIHTTGALGKLFAEVVENIDMKPVEGVRSTGAAGCPHALCGAAAGHRSFASYALLRFEINVREARVMGFVGAGGIGQDLIDAIRKFYYSDVSAILVTIIVTVFVIDIATGWLRGRCSARKRGHEPGARRPQRAQLRARYPQVFDRPASARLATPAMALLAFAHLHFRPGRSRLLADPALQRLHQLGWITLMMLPPDPGSSLPLYLRALGETLSIALLGTTLAAVAALPFGLLAARNIMPRRHPFSGAPVPAIRSAASIR